MANLRKLRYLSGFLFRIGIINHNNCIINNDIGIINNEFGVFNIRISISNIEYGISNKIFGDFVINIGNIIIKPKSNMVFLVEVLSTPQQIPFLA